MQSKVMLSVVEQADEGFQAAERAVVAAYRRRRRRAWKAPSGFPLLRQTRRVPKQYAFSMHHDVLRYRPLRLHNYQRELLPRALLHAEVQQPSITLREQKRGI